MFSCTLLLLVAIACVASVEGQQKKAKASVAINSKGEYVNMGPPHLSEPASLKDAAGRRSMVRETTTPMAEGMEWPEADGSPYSQFSSLVESDDEEVHNEFERFSAGGGGFDMLARIQDMVRSAKDKLTGGYNASMTSMIALGSTTTSLAEGIKGLETDVLNMLKDGKANEDTLKLIDRIELLVKSGLSANIENGHSQSQELLGKVLEQTFGPCATTQAADEAIAQPFLTNFTAASSAHTACRAREEQQWLKWNNCTLALGPLNHSRTASCKLYDESKATVDNVHEHRALWRQLKDNTAEYIDGMATYFEGLRDELAQYTEVCDEHTSTVDSKAVVCDADLEDLNVTQATCDAEQAAMDAAVCQYAVAQNTACSKSTICRAQANNSYNTAIAHAKEQEVDRKAEWEVVTHVSCILGVARASLEDGYTGIPSIEDEKKRCGTEAVDVQHLQLEFHEPPPLVCVPVMTSSPNYPCSDAYKASWYDVLPAHAQAKDCNVCEGLE